ncbi:glutamyl-tRNA reductase [Nannocystis pusilla]|uniref:Glutamyl-tRNA reductase n=1 Tax=Nannocystis pusilla TaxID=889268 RepID=A0ABS7TUE5_9BACT|nr:glutamyl-tRNA reductase [Nannocystis pusilla]MBZ5711831.1 glutamyl-tRNA reductase [Nannocystis pusilla]
MTELVAVGLNHKTAPVELRERLAFGTGDVAAALSALRERAGLGEVMIVSTCNRVEVYAVAPHWARAGERVLQALADTRAVPLAELVAHTFVRGERAAASHICRVAASLESMVVGEPQILGQVKDAFELAQREGTVGGVLDRCLGTAFRAAKRVRSETEVARGAASVPSVAVDLARSIFGELTGSGALLVGAGEMASQAGIHLKAAGVAEMTVVNRSEARGRALAEELTARYAPWDSLDAELRRADIVVTSTGAQRPVIDRALLRPVMKVRRGKPIFFVDIAVPRDVEPEVARLEQVFLYNIDDLQGIVHDNMRARAAEAERAGSLVEEEVGEFVAWQRARSIGPIVQALQHHARGIAEAELARVRGKLQGLAPEQQKAVEALANGIVQKLLHRPMAALRQAAVGEGAEADLAGAVQQLFGLEVPSATAVAEASAASMVKRELVRE